MIRWALVLGFSLGLVAVLYLATGSGAVSPAELLRDPAATVGYPVRIGALSNLGVVGWTCAASVLAFAGFAAEGAPMPERNASLSLALLLAVLGLDDLFLLHERVLPGKAGIPQGVVLAAYGIGAAVIGLLHRDIWWRRENRTLLGFAAVAFAASLAIDLNGVPGQVAIEDGAKLVGIATLTVWSFVYGRSLVSERDGDAGD